MVRPSPKARRKSSASARRIAPPSAAHDAGRLSPASPPPVTYSCRNKVGLEKAEGRPMRIIPVLDVQDGLAVAARAGDRAHYHPVRSILHEGSEPIGIARAY